MIWNVSRIGSTTKNPVASLSCQVGCAPLKSWPDVLFLGARLSKYLRYNSLNLLVVYPELGYVLARMGPKTKFYTIWKTQVSHWNCTQKTIGFQILAFSFDPWCGHCAVCPLLVLIDPVQPFVQREHGQKGVASCRASIETEAGGRMMISVSMPFYRHTVLILIHM